MESTEKHFALELHTRQYYALSKGKALFTHLCSLKMPTHLVKLYFPSKMIV